MQKYTLDLYNHIISLGIDLKIVLFPWVLSIMCVIVPLQHIHKVYEGFLARGWSFIYRAILSLFLYHRDKCIEFEESGDLLVFLSASNPNSRSADWENIFEFERELRVDL